MSLGPFFCLVLISLSFPVDPCCHPIVVIHQHPLSPMQAVAHSGRGGCWGCRPCLSLFRCLLSLSHCLLSLSRCLLLSSRCLLLSSCCLLLLLSGCCVSFVVLLSLPVVLKRLLVTKKWNETKELTDGPRDVGDISWAFLSFASYPPSRHRSIIVIVPSCHLPLFLFRRFLFQLTGSLPSCFSTCFSPREQLLAVAGAGAGSWASSSCCYKIERTYI
jgi:hypothetical protein